MVLSPPAGDAATPGDLLNVVAGVRVTTLDEAAEAVEANALQLSGACKGPVIIPRAVALDFRYTGNVNHSL